MNVYEASIWCDVHHGSEFSHNSQRVQLIHALNEERAKKKITLAPKKTCGTDTIISTEFIYSIRKTGTVVIKPYYVYSDGRSPRPVYR
jgi:hypothetical protein